MKRMFRGSTYDITVRTGAKAATRVDGQPWHGDVIPAFGDGKRHRVEVVVAAAASRNGTHGTSNGKSKLGFREEPVLSH